MAKYMLRRGVTRLPIDGVREIHRDGLPPLMRAETVVFEPGMAVESDLDFGSWVEDGTLVVLREYHESPRKPKPDPEPEVKKEILTPMPEFVQVEVAKESAPEEPIGPDASSAPLESSVAEGETPSETPSETPRRRRGR